MRRGYDAGRQQAGAPPTTSTSTRRYRYSDGAASARFLYDAPCCGIQQSGYIITLYDYEARLSSWGSHPTPVDRTTAPRRGNASASRNASATGLRRRGRTVVVEHSALERCTRRLRVVRQSRREISSVVVDDSGVISSTRNNDMRRRWTHLDSALRDV